MNLLITGGGGEEGGSFVKDLMQFYDDDISHVVLSDINEKHLMSIASSLSSKKVSTKVIDICDHQALVKAMLNVDMVVNFVGPFYRWGTRVLKASIETRKNYIDIDDDSESTLEKLDLHEEAEAAGIIAIIGLGSGPGSDNLLAMHGAKKLDKVDEINIYWTGNFPAAGTSKFIPPAVNRHLLHGFQTAGPQLIDGKFVNMPPFSGATWVDFDPPVGRAEVVYFGHPEAVTLPRYIKGLRKCTNRGGTVPHFRMRRFREAFNLGFTREEPINVQGYTISPIDIMAEMENSFIPDECLGDPVSGIRVEIKGEKNGKPQEIVYADSTTTVANVTAPPTSVGVYMLAKGDIKKKGVFAPEGCINDFSKFMTELKKRDTVI